MRWLCWLLIGNTVGTAPLQAEPLRRFTVRDSVEMAYFGDLLGSLPRRAGDDAIFSPDGRYYARLTHRGVLLSGAIESTIWLFETASIVKYLRHQQAEAP